MRIALQTYGKMVLLFPEKHFKVAKFKKMKPLKLNVDCGKAKLSGWVNIDIEPGADLVIDIRKRLLFNDGNVDFIYSEHVLEHLILEGGENVLREFQRCLRRESIVRIAMPDLDYIIQRS